MIYVFKEDIEAPRICSECGSGQNSTPTLRKTTKIVRGTAPSLNSPGNGGIRTTNLTRNLDKDEHWQGRGLLCREASGRRFLKETLTRESQMWASKDCETFERLLRVGLTPSWGP